MADIVMGLIEMVGSINSIINWCKEYYKSVRNAATSMTRIIVLLGSWKPQLELLEDLITTDDQKAQSMRMRLASDSTLQETRRCLQDLERLVKPEPGISAPSDNDRGRRKLADLYEKLTWPILKQDKANELIRELETHKSSINMLLCTETAWNMSGLQEEVKQCGAKLTDQEARTVLNWLRPDKIDCHEIHLEKQEMIEDETCDWMIRSEIWIEWTKGGSTSEYGHRRFLWIHGIPGAGKTILASFLIDTIALRCQSKGYSYYYCSHQRGQDETRSFLQWVLKDLCTQSDHLVPTELHHTYNQYKHNIHSVSIDIMLKCLMAVTKEFTKQFNRQVFIVVDAVDESSQPRNRFLRVLTTIGTDPAFGHVSLLMTSRDELEIRAALEALPPLEQTPTFLETGVIHTPQVSPFRPTAPYIRQPPPGPSTYVPSPLGTPSRGPTPGFGSPSHPQTPTRSPNAMNPYWTAQASSESLIAQQPETRYSSPQRSSWDRKRKSKPEDFTSEEPHTPSQRPIRTGRVATPGRSPRGEILVPEIHKPNQAYTELSMDNHFVLKAIRTYVHHKLQRIDQFRYLRPEFLEKTETQLARDARGMFRWVACQIDMMNKLELSDEAAIENLLENLPKTVFDTYERLIAHNIPDADGHNQNNRTFARTALALICSNTAAIPSADVLVEASLFNVQRGLSHAYNVHRLEKILGCLIKVTRLNRRPQSHFKRDDEGAVRFRVAPAHYTVKEYLYAKGTAEGPAKDFALSTSTTQVLELQVVFNGLLVCGIGKAWPPTRYEEYCLRMTDRALRQRRGLVVQEQSIMEPVLQCLRPNANHHQVFRRNQGIRNMFPRWGELNAVFRVDKGAVLPAHEETGILVSLLVLKWPELAGIFLRGLTADQRAAIWTDRFTTTGAEAEAGGGRGRGGGQPAPPGAVGTTTILQLCVSLRRIEFLEQLIEAGGADFAHETGILYAALREPYAPAGDGPSAAAAASLGQGKTMARQKKDDGAITGQLLKMVLQRGADPNPRGYQCTPLQVAVRHLEERWVQSLLIEHADANAVGDPEGAHPFSINGGGGECVEDDEDWFEEHPLWICREIDPNWSEVDDFELPDQIRHARLRVENLLLQYGAEEPEEEEDGQGEADDGSGGGGGSASQPEVIVIDS